MPSSSAQRAPPCPRDACRRPRSFWRCHQLATAFLLQAVPETLEHPISHVRGRGFRRSRMQPTHVVKRTPGAINSLHLQKNPPPLASVNPKCPFFTARACTDEVGREAPIVFTIFSSTTLHRGQPKLDKFFCQLGGLKPSLAPRLIFTNHSKLVDFERSLHSQCEPTTRAPVSRSVRRLKALHPHTVRLVLGVGVQDRDRNAEHATLPFGPPGVPLFSFHLVLGPEREPLHNK